MRVCWGIVVVMCMGLPASGVASQQQDPSGPATTAGQAPASGVPPGETPSEQKKEPEAEPQKKTDAGAGGANEKRQAGKKRAAATDEGPRKVIGRRGGADEPTAQIVT